MQNILTSVHSVLAYVVLIVLILAFLNAISGWLSKREKFEMSKDLRISLFALILSHIQLLLGLIVYFGSTLFPIIPAIKACIATVILCGSLLLFKILRVDDLKWLTNILTK